MDRLDASLGNVDLSKMLSLGGSNNDVGDLLSSIGGGAHSNAVSLTDLLASQRSMASPTVGRATTAPGSAPGSASGGQSLSAALAAMSPRGRAPSGTSSTASTPSSLPLPTPPSSWSTAPPTERQISFDDHPSEDETSVALVVGHHSAGPLSAHPYPVTKVPLRRDCPGDLVAVTHNFICYVVKNIDVRVLCRLSGARIILPGVDGSHIVHMQIFADAKSARRDLVLIGCQDGRIRIFSVNGAISGQEPQVKLEFETRLPSGLPVSVLEWSPSSTVFAAGDGHHISVFRLVEGTSTPVPVTSGNLSSCAFAAEDVVLYGNDSFVKVFAVAVGAIVQEWQAYDQVPVERVVLLSPAVVLTTASNNTWWRIWRLEQQDGAMVSVMAGELRWKGVQAGRTVVVAPNHFDQFAVVAFVALALGRVVMLKVDSHSGAILKTSGGIASEFQASSAPLIGLVASRGPTNRDDFGPFDLFTVTAEAVDAHPVTVDGWPQQLRASSSAHQPTPPKPAQSFFTPGVVAAASAAADGALEAEAFDSDSSDSEVEANVKAVVKSRDATGSEDSDEGGYASGASDPSSASELDEALRDEVNTEQPDLGLSGSDDATDEDLALTGSSLVPLEHDDNLVGLEHDDSVIGLEHDDSVIGLSPARQVATSSRGISAQEVAAIVAEALKQQAAEVEKQQRAFLATVVQTVNSSIAFHVEKQVQRQLGDALAAIKQEAKGQDSGALQAEITASFASAFERTLIPAFERASGEMLHQLSASVERSLASSKPAKSAETAAAPAPPAGVTLEEAIALVASGAHEEAFSKALRARNPLLVNRLCQACEDRDDLPGAADLMPHLANDPPTVLSLIGQVGLFADMLSSEHRPLLPARLAWLNEALMVLDPSDASIKSHARSLLAELSKNLATAVDSAAGTVPASDLRALKILLHLLKGLLPQQ